MTQSSARLAATHLSLDLVQHAESPSPWVPRTSTGERIQTRRSLRAALRAADAAGRRHHLQLVALTPRALLDVLVDSECPTELVPLACQALSQLDPSDEEHLLLQVVRHLLFRTPGPLLTRLGELARRARGSSATLAEQTLLALLSQLGQPDREGWRRALPVVRALARGGSQRAIEPLVGLLAATDPLHRDGGAVGEALTAIASRGLERQVVKTLVARLRQSQHPIERYFGHLTLARLGSRYATPYLEEQVAQAVAQRTNPRAALRPCVAAAIQALGRADSPEGVRTLLALEARLGHRDLVLRECLYAALGHAQRTARALGLVPLLIDWLEAAERRRDPFWLLRTLGETLVRLTGQRIAPRHADWFRYLAQRPERPRLAPAVPTPPAALEPPAQPEALQPVLVYPEAA